MKYWCCALLLAIVASTESAQSETVLYDASLEILPAEQPWLLYADDGFLNGGVASQTRVDNGVNLSTDVVVSSGYSNTIPIFGFFKNRDFPVLDRQAGFDIDFQLQVHSEKHDNDDRAGFSVIVVSNDLQAIELGFWQDEVWAQGDDPLFKHAEGASFDSTLDETPYQLSVRGDRYDLTATGASILSGELRDYSTFGQPYNLPSFVFLGDDTGSAGAAILLGDVVLTTDPAAAVPLQAGDADQDGDFDQFDLIRVQQAAKYFTGLPATWGEGDWNGAPGGTPGSPPLGNGLFDQFDIIRALAPGHYLTGPYAAVLLSGQQDDGQTSMIHDSTTGELGVDTPSGTELTSINIDSAAGIFTGSAAQNLGGSFKHAAADRVFRATSGSGFGSLSLGNIAREGLSEEFVLNDLTVVDSLSGGGDLGDVDLIYIPEPSSLLLALLGIVGLLHWRR